MPPLLHFIYVAIGGSLGSVVRFTFLSAWRAYAGIPRFPWPTFISNIVGSLVLGILMAWVSKHADATKTAALFLFLGIGFCGGLTTFSTFVYEISVLFKNTPLLSIFYLTTSLVAGLICLGIGYYSVKF